MSAKGLEILNHRTREKIVIDRARFCVDHVSEAKAGGTGTAMGTALFQWFLLEIGDGEHSFVDRGVLTWPRGESSPDPRRGELYADVTDRVVGEILEAERLADPSDFPAMEYDMGSAIGFIPRLREIWLQKRPSHC